MGKPRAVVVSAAFDRELRAAVSRAIRGHGFRRLAVADRFTWVRRDDAVVLVIEIAETARHRWSFFREEKQARRTPLRVEAALIFPFLPPSPNYSRPPVKAGDVPDLRDAHFHRLLRPAPGTEWPRRRRVLPELADGVRRDLLPWVLRVSRPDEAYRELVASIRSWEAKGEPGATHSYEMAEILAKRLGEPAEEWIRKQDDIEAEQRRRLYEND